MNKRKSDYRQGDQDREGTTEYLNLLLPKWLSFQKYYRTYLSTTGKELNYLHYCLTHARKHPGLPFVFLYKRTGMYIKVPPQFLDNPQRYLDKFIAENYYLLLIDDEGDKEYFSRPIPFHEVNKWDWKMSEADGNTNRMQFSLAINKIEYRHPMEQGNNFFDSRCLIDKLIGLFE